MKKLSILALAAVGLLFGACSSDKDVAEAGNDYKFVEGQTSFIAIGLATPGNPNTRANDDLDDGEASEYAVYDGMLVLFKGTSEANALLVKAYDITNEITGWNEEEDDNKPKPSSAGEISHTSQRVVKAIDNPSLGSGQKLFAYVILNSAGNGLAVSNTPGTSFKDFSRQIFDKIGNLSSGNGLVMTSVPLSNGTQGGSVNPTGANQTTLAEVDASCIYESLAMANANTDAACIYVERAAVKVEVVLGASVKDPITNSALTEAAFSWGLGNTNSTYFNTRQVKSDWLPYFNTQMLSSDLNMKYRFVGNTSFFNTPSTATSTGTDTGHRPEFAYRTYWAEDVNYNRDVTSGELGNTVVSTYLPFAGTGSTKVVYTYENTFDEDHQTYKNTTYVGFKVQLNDGTAFWTVSSDADKKLDSKTSAANKIQQDIDIAIKGSIIETWKSNIVSEISTQLATAGSALRTAGANAGDDITFTLSHNVQISDTRNADGSHNWTDALEITEITYNGSAITSGDIYDAVVAIITAEGALARLDLRSDVQELNLKAYSYTDGYAYYTMRISHFGDTETPWEADPSDANQYDKIYPITGTNPLLNNGAGKNFGASRAAAWLGRWGIVRNNWYVLSIDEITGIGSAEPVDYSGTIGSTPDDNPEPKYYIAAHIHILPWVKRIQSVSF